MTPYSTKPINLSRNGHSFKVIPGNYGPFWSDLANGIWEPETFTIFDRFLKHNTSYIDIGSWIGPTLLYGAQHASRAYGIEPDPIAYMALGANIALNPQLAKKIQLFNGCIAPSTGPAKFGNPNQNAGDSMSSLLFGNCETAWTVDALTFDDFINRYHITDCSFIKLDIEGGEYSVVPTMLSFLRKHRPTLYLSLHPKHLLRINGNGYLSKCCRGLVSLVTMSRILSALSFYTHFYDAFGNCLSPVRRLQISRSCSAIIASDERWN